MLLRYPKCYMWTFTFPQVMPDWWYARGWSEMIEALAKVYGGRIGGVRVVEAHRQHGLHFHVLVNQRVSVHLMRRLGKRLGFGRLHVVRADLGSVRYLVKYLVKDRTPLFGAVRRWRVFGNVVATRKRDVVIDSPFHERLARMKEAVPKVSKVLLDAVYRFSGDEVEYQAFVEGVRSRNGVLGVGVRKERVNEIKQEAERWRKAVKR